MKEQMKIILSAGGTGGHIYPAIAIADELSLRYPKINISFIGAKDKMEMEKIPQAGYKIKGLWISGIQRKFTFKNILFPFKVAISLFVSLLIINKIKPILVIGTGGFASWPALMISIWKKIPVIIQEQNSFPGITNKILSRRAKIICVAYDNLEKFFPKEKIIKTGNPVRRDLLDVNKKNNIGKDFFKIKNNKKVVLVIGGSLGSKRINELIEFNLEFFKNNDIELIWQCGKLYYDKYKNFDKLNNVQVHQFINRMDYAYACASFIISRSGASSVSELCIVGKPTIFIPSPNVAEDHQTKNAQLIVNKGGAVLIKENELNKFPVLFKELLNNEQKQKSLSKNIKSLAFPNATNDIVKEIEKLINKY